MTKYINADDLLSVLKDVHPMDYYGMALKAQVISLPSADVVEVVRCKDCKYRLKEWRSDKRLKDKGYWAYGCEHFAELMGYWGWGGDDYDFCSYGERKESKVKKCFDIPKEVAERLLEDTDEQGT